MLITLIFAEGRRKENVETKLRQDRSDRKITFAKEQYNGESFASKETPEFYKYASHGNEWYVGKGCDKYVGVIVQIDNDEPSKPILSDMVYDIDLRRGIPEAIEDFDNKIIKYLTEQLDSNNYIDLDDIII